MGDMNKPNLLWISYFAPYDKVPHAGGKIHNYYIKELKKIDEFNIKLISFATKNEESLIDIDRYNIDNTINYYTWDGIEGFIFKVINFFSKLNFFNKYAGLTTYYFASKVKKSIKLANLNGYYPDIIILQWTEMLLLMDDIKKIYPKSKYVAIEEDISFQSILRKCNASSGLDRYIKYKKYSKLKSLELNKLKNSDLIILNNYKDRSLIENENIINNAWIWCPYFQNNINIKRNYCDSRLIIFYGAMFREENYLSAIWFIEKVMPIVEDLEVKFIVIGSRPNQNLMKYASSNVEILGFVDDISPYLSEALCLVAPLRLGAGVKIKILEAFSSGIPVLTNDIGIEGIPAKNNVEYFHCNTPMDYENIIRKLVNKKMDIDNMEKASKDLISSCYSIDDNPMILNKKLCDLLEDK